MNKIILWSGFLGPWLTLFFMKKATIKRYMPLMLFTALMATITSLTGYSYTWWKNYDKILPWGDIASPSLLYGLFPVLTLWIFYFTYRNFWLYMTANIVINAFQWFFLIRWTFMAWGIVEFVNITRFWVFVLCIFQALLVYGYQRWQEGIFQKDDAPDSDGEIHIKILSLRSKAR